MVGSKQRWPVPFFGRDRAIHNRRPVIVPLSCNQASWIGSDKCSPPLCGTSFPQGSPPGKHGKTPGLLDHGLIISIPSGSRASSQDRDLHHVVVPFGNSGSVIKANGNYLDLMYCDRFRCPGNQQALPLHRISKKQDLPHPGEHEPLFLRHGPTKHHAKRGLQHQMAKQSPLKWWFRPRKWLQDAASSIKLWRPPTTSRHDILRLPAAYPRSRRNWLIRPFCVPISASSIRRNALAGKCPQTFSQDIRN